MKDYIVSDTGTSYYGDTSLELINHLETIRADRTRIRLYYGDIKTGRDWGDVYDVTGIISRSCGNVQIPILIHNNRSHGGGAILTHCIVRIDYANKKNGGTIYKHKLFH